MTTSDANGAVRWGQGMSEQEVWAGLAAELAAPNERECLFCYVHRMLGYGCDATLRWALHWRALRAPRLTGLVARLNARGGFCDCEIFLNGWQPRELVIGVDGQLDYPEEMPACTGVRAGSGQPCQLWVPIPRGPYGGW